MSRGALIQPDPTYRRLHFPTISPFSYECIGTYLHAIVAFGLGSAAWPLTNLSLLIPLSIWETLTIKEVFWRNGTGTGGNVDVGIYASDAATLLASLGSTAKGAASVPVSSTTWTDYVLSPGDYYMACAVDGTTNMTAQTTAAGLLAATGVLEAASNFPLATGITPLITTRAYLPTFGLAQDSTAL